MEKGQSIATIGTQNAILSWKPYDLPCDSQLVSHKTQINSYARN